MRQEVFQKDVTSADGTRLRMYVVGPPVGEWIVLANGLGGNIEAWRYLVEHFSQKYRILTWDYRGLYRSSKPKENSVSAYSMERQCEDLEAVLKAEEVEKAVFIGWSMGVQVLLEFYKRHKEKFLAMVLINGTFGRPFETAFRSQWMRKVGKPFLEVMPRLTPLFRLSRPLVAKTPLFINTVKMLGLVGPTLDHEVFYDLCDDWLQLDFDAYSKTFEALAEHDASDCLPNIECPTLIIAGEKDLFTPKEVAERMRAEIPQAELVIVQNGSHYTPVEYPASVNLHIETFLTNRVFVRPKKRR